MEEKNTFKISKKLQSFIDNISYLGDSTIPEDSGKIYYSKFGNSYITRKGREKDFNIYLKYGITEQLQSAFGEKEHSERMGTTSLGFNPVEQKWYGWSHRAIYGFGVGSKIKNGSCGFKASNKEEFKEDCLRFWGDLDMDGDTHKVNPVAREEEQDGELGIYVEYTYDNEVPNKSMRGELSGMFSAYPKQWGKGKWEAETLEDAKQMAIDFAKSVS